ncbi:AraC-like DNA-binding protein [Luteibacter sp. Sphag1AF]|uniref:AraC family transcriptional regulator n=1 Tax=Luteibacter sp. Sphag1AF TaxID=2587031 RepID=UPI0016188D51|nr:helix-turn-helix transcriptional regulator [Luteibacter sp. Sphag1AF]MBB3228225.1 AraC-like DNA-binding protein [Luteibacter sp. Sphag1AF]
MTKRRVSTKPIDHSERTEGPGLIAVRGDAADGGDFRLGTREIDWHHHVRGQVFCVESGLMHVRTRQGSWLLPPHRAGWIPPGEPHKISVTGVMGGWSLLIAPRACRPLPKRPCVIGVNELMLALVRRAVSWSDLDELSTAQKRMAAVLLEEIRHAPHEALHLPMPVDRRLLRIANAVLRQPNDSRTLEQWAEWAGLSSRTLSRLFAAETALSFAQWRQQARLTHALEMLAQGVPVAEIADALGYATPSNFIAMFRRGFGSTPGRFFVERGG